MKFISGLSLVAVLRMFVARTHSGPPTSPSGTHARLIALTGVADLDVWFARSMEHSVVLFLHDAGCPISAAAYRQMNRVDAEIALIDVRTERALSHAVESRTGVVHESPQVIVLKGGQAAWSASHFAITADAVEAARRES